MVYKLKFLLIFIIGNIIIYKTYAQRPTYSSLTYTTKSLTDLEHIYKPFLKNFKVYNQDLKMVRVTKKVNTKTVKDFNQIPAGITLQLFFNHELIDLAKVNTYLTRSKKSKFNPKKVGLQSIKITTGEKDSLAKLFRRFALPSAIIRKKTPIVQATLNARFNEDIKNWKNLPTKRQVELFISKDLIDMNKVARFLESEKRKESFLAKRQKQTIMARFKKKKKKKKTNQNIFVMTSIGTFTQKDATYGNASFAQNSPATIGYMFNKDFKNTLLSLSSSIYISYLQATSSNITSSNTDVPMEIGVNSYLEYKTKSGQIFSGIDIERFNTFNIEGINRTNDLLLDQNLLSFLTLGYGNAFQILKAQTLFFKISLSQSLFSSRDSSYSEEVASGQTYSGQKFMFFTGVKFTDKWSANFLIKQHFLSGPSSVNSTRMGIGASYLF